MAGSRVVVDSSIFIQYLRATKKTSTKLYQVSKNHTILVSSVTLYELYLGAKDESKWQDVEILTAGLPVLSFDFKVSIEAAKIYHQLRKKNRMIEFRDIFIAATAKIHGFPVITLNKKHFKRIEELIVLE